jgi:ABC-type nickel/cobalt efflux system permease component RcnA
MSHDPNQNHPVDDTSTWWIARHENTNKIWYGLVTVCVLLVLTDFVYHGFFHEKHGYFVFETAIAFHGIYGFGAFVFVVLLGKELRKLIMRSEDYYAIPITEPAHDDHHDSHGHHDSHNADNEGAHHA